MPERHARTKDSAPSGAPPKKRPARRISLLIVVLCLISLGVFLLPLGLNFFLSTSALTGYLQESLTRATGRKVTIVGDVRITSWPWLGVKIGPMSIADPPEFGDEPMLVVASSTVRIRPLPLLRRVVAPADITVKGLRLLLKRNADGKANWSGLPFFMDEAAFTPEPPEALGWSVSPRPRGMRLADATVVYEDKELGRRVRLDRLNLSTGYGERFNFSLSFDVSGLKPGFAALFNAKGVALFDSETGRVAVRDGLVEASCRIPRRNAPPGEAFWPAALRAGAAFDSVSGRLALTDLDARGLGVGVNGSLVVSNLSDAPLLAGDLSIRAGAGGDWTAALGLVPDIKGHPGLTAAQTDERGRPTPPRSFFSADPKREKPPVTITTAFTAERRSLLVKSFNLEWKDARLAGRAEAVVGDAGRLVFSAEAEGFDLNDLVFVESGKPISLHEWIPRDMDVDGTVDVRNIRFADVYPLDGHAVVRARRGRVRVYPASLRLPGGVVNADLRASPQKDRLDFEAEAVATALRADSGKGPGGELPSAAFRAVGALAADKADGRLAFSGSHPAVLGRMFDPAANAAEEKTGPRSVRGTSHFTVAFGPTRFFESVRLDGCRVRFGETTLTGDAAYTNHGRARAEFDLRADRLVLDDPPIRKDAAASPAASPAASAAASAAAFPAGKAVFPGPARIDGTLSVASLQVFGTGIKDFSVSGALERGRLRGAVFTGGLFRGRLSGKADMDFTPGARAFNLSASLAGADGGELTRVLAGRGLLAGPVDLSLSAEGAGGTYEALAASLSGKLSAVSSKGGVLSPGPGRKKKNAKPSGTRYNDLRAELSFEGGASDKERRRVFAAKGNLSFTTPGLLRRAEAGLEGNVLLAPDGGGAAVREAAFKAQLETRPGKGKRAADVTLSGLFSVDQAASAWSLENVSVKAAGAAASGVLSGSWKNGAVLGGRLAFAEFDPRKALSALSLSPPDGLNKDLFKKAGLEFDVRGDGKGLFIENISLRLGDDKLAGTVSFPGYDFSDAHYDLLMGRLDIDHWFPSEPHEDDSGTTPFNMKALRDLRFSSRVRIGRLTCAGAVWSDVVLTGKAAGGRFDFTQKAKDFYGGAFDGKLTADARDVVLKTLLDIKIDNFDSASLINTWVPEGALDYGDTAFVAAANSSGAAAGELLDNLAGSARFQVVRGALVLRPPPEHKTGGAQRTRAPRPGPAGFEPSPPEDRGLEIQGVERLVFHQKRRRLQRGHSSSGQKTEGGGQGKPEPGGYASGCGSHGPCGGGNRTAHHHYRPPGHGQTQGGPLRTGGRHALSPVQRVDFDSGQGRGKDHRKNRENP